LCRTEIEPKETSIAGSVKLRPRGNVATTLYPLRSEAKAMSDLVTEDELARARKDPAFRQQFLAQNLNRLIEALKRMRRASEQTSDTDRQLREGADLAVQLADRLQTHTPARASPD
jgi:hypothetical protein